MCNERLVSYKHGVRMSTAAGWPASSEPLACWALVFLVFRLYLCINMYFPGNRRMEKGGPKVEHVRVCFGPLLMKNAHPRKRQHVRAPQPHLSRILSVSQHRACEMVFSAQELYTVELELRVICAFVLWVQSIHKTHFSSCRSQGFGCRAAVRRSMRLTMTRRAS